jgi:hypothetical protein
VTYPVLMDINRILPDIYPLSRSTPFPVDVVIDQDGIIRYAHSEYEPQLIIAEIEALLESGGIDTIVNDINNQKTSPVLDLSLFPNPTNTLVTISITLPDQIPGADDLSLTVYSILGEIVIEENVPILAENRSIKIQRDLQGLSSGIYFVTVRIGGLSDSKKLMLLK